MPKAPNQTPKHLHPIHALQVSDSRLPDIGQTACQPNIYMRMHTYIYFLYICQILYKEMLTLLPLTELAPAGLCIRKMIVIEIVDKEKVNQPWLNEI